MCALSAKGEKLAVRIKGCLLSSRRLALLGGGEKWLKERDGAMRRQATRLYQALQIESTQAESQWIVEQVYSQHLQYLEAIKSSAKDLSLPIFEIAIDLTVRMKLGRSLYLSCNKGRGV